MQFRWLILAVVVACMGISAVHRHRARRTAGTIERRREGAGLMTVRALVAMPLFAAVVFTVAHPPAMTWASMPLPEWVRWVGAGLGILAVPLCLWVFASLGANVSETVLTRDEHTLVIHGPYRWVRHPLYATGIALFLGVGLMAASWFILVGTALVVVLILKIVVPAEERQLLAKFGEDYRGLMRRTGRLLPRFGGATAAESRARRRR